MNLHPPPLASFRWLIGICCGLGFLTYLTSYMRIPLVPLFAQELGAGPVMVGLINSAFLLTSGVFAFPCGLLGDRLGRRLVVSGGLGLSLVTSLLLAVSFAPWQLLLIYLLFGLGMAAVGPTLMATVADLSPATHLGRSYGAYTLAIYTGMSLGPALGGWLAEYVGFRLLFVVAAGLVALVMGAAYYLLPGSAGSYKGKGDEPASGPWPLRDLFSHWALLGCWLLTLGGCFGVGMFVTFAPLHMKEQTLTAGQIGTVFALQAGVNALSRIPCGRLSDRLGARWLQAALGFLLLAFSLLIFGWRSTYAHFLLAGMLMGLAMGLGFTPVGALIAEVVPPAARGLAMGGYNTCIYLGMMCGSGLMGGIIQKLGYQGAYGLSAAVVAGATLGFGLLVRKGY